MSSATFQAKRTYSSGELLALRRQQAERVQLPLRSNNLQDSSELTARRRKFASVLSADLPFLPTQGNSTNMVKWRDASVVQAMREGQVYRASEVSQPAFKYPLSCTGVPIPFLRTDVSVPTQPKVIGCDLPIPEEQRVLQPFNLAEHFGMRKNDNKVVIASATYSGTCQSCDPIDK